MRSKRRRVGVLHLAVRWCRCAAFGRPMRPAAAAGSEAGGIDQSRMQRAYLTASQHITPAPAWQGTHARLRTRKRTNKALRHSLSAAVAAW